jgi:hypothetical protein
MRRLTPVLVGAMLLFSACSSNSDEETWTPSSPPCAPGEQTPCDCPGNGQGVRTCVDDGTGYGACTGCGVAGSGGTSGSGGTGGSSGSGVGGAPAGNPCGDISLMGECTTDTQVKICMVATGDEEPYVETINCGPLESCKVLVGVARCQLDPNKCQPGGNACTSTSTARWCDASGLWQSYDCADCKNAALGVTCSGTFPTTAHAGFLKYEVRSPDYDKLDWSADPFIAPAQGVLVVSYRWDPATSSHTMLDAVQTDKDGAYTVKVPISPQAEDVVVFWAIRSMSDGIAFAVAEPDVSDGTWELKNPIPSATSRYWGWKSTVPGLGASGDIITIKTTQGSGAMRVYDYLRYVYDQSYNIMQTPGKPLVVWLRFNTTWSCGSCALGSGGQVGTDKFDSQIWISASAANQQYWSDAVVAHELGHWAMNSWGKSPGEGGYHMLGCVTYPGQAWSEGWATWFQGAARTSSIYFDKQGSGLFWFDLGERKYSKTMTWQRPKPSGGLLQLIDENEVSAILWGMTLQTPPAFGQAQNQKFFAALASARMKSAPFGRGYTRHTWSPVKGTCNKTDVATNAAWSAPMLADFLDALVCAGFPASTVDASTQPSTYYPYPSDKPICN